MTTRDLRIWGGPPYRVALVHGGPGTPGSMGPVARRLSERRGILEPLQTADSLDGQVEELSTVLRRAGTLPLTLVGHSWGAILGLVFSARHSSLVKKLILVGSAPLDRRYEQGTRNADRIQRLPGEQRADARSLLETIRSATGRERDAAWRRLGPLLTKADAYDPLTLDTEELEIQADLNERVWATAKPLRDSGELIELARAIRCPVVAVHGDSDLHPAAGIRKPLATAIDDFHFVMLDRCGHVPWIERHAAEPFFAVLERELADV